MNTFIQARSLQYSFTLALMFLFITTQPAMAIQIITGDLLTELNSTDYGDKDDNSWQQPHPSTLTNFGDVIDAFLNEDFNRADFLANEVGYEIVEYNDTERTPVKTYYVLREINEYPSALFVGGGTYVLNPQGSNVAIQAPHPITDAFTSQQAIETFLSSQSRLLFLAGVRRDSSTSLSECTGDHYRKSDASHSTGLLFYTAHTHASDFYPELIFIQFHGFGKSSLKKLQNQCGSNNNKLVNLSEGVKYQSNPAGNSFMQILQRNINDDGVFEACVYGNDTKSLGATWTTTGRYSNHSADPCHSSASTSSQRFIHVEQSYRIRSRYRALMANYLADTINEYF